MPRGKPEAPLIERFLRRVNKTDKCWEWRGAKYTTGYGQLNESVWGEHTTHRWSYKYYHNKDIPNGYEICHSCDNRWCVNPEHLTAEPKIENIKQKNERHSQPNNRSFTKEQVEEIRALRATGLFYKDIAERYGCNRRTIERIFTGVYYSNV
jgi:AraC-like DNA-binding protein